MKRSKLVLSTSQWKTVPISDEDTCTTLLQSSSMYMVPSSCLWGGVPDPTSKDIFPAKTALETTNLSHSKQFVCLCLKAHLNQSSKYTHEDIVVVSDFPNLQSHVEYEHPNRPKTKHSSQNEGSDCVIMESTDTKLNDSGCISIVTDNTPHSIDDECVSMEIESPILIRDSSVDAVSETDIEDCYTDSKQLLHKQESPLPGLWSLLHKIPQTYTHEHSSPHTQKHSSHTSIEQAMTNSTPDPWTQQTKLYSASSQSIVLGVTGNDGSRYLPEDDLTKDEGIVIDDSPNCHVCESSDDVTIVKVVEGRGVSSRRGEIATRVDSTPVIECCGIRLTRADLNTLRPLQWLNDQIINSYMKLLMHSYTSSLNCHHKTAQGLHIQHHKRAHVHITSTFFYTKLRTSGYSGVERWLKNVDMMRLRLLLVPVHLGTHWCLAAVDFRAKCIVYYDSMGGRNMSCLRRLKYFLVKCSQNKKCQRVNRWRLCYPEGVPLQHNGSDCGVFVCQFARWLCSTRNHKSGAEIPFTQKHMLQFRTNMLEELKLQRLI